MHVNVQEDKSILILTRRIGEELIIGDEVVIAILGIKGHYARLGINAPKTISVHRMEVYQKLKDDPNYYENRELLKCIKPSP
jgi:carbon storage regulator CsrA